MGELRAAVLALVIVAACGSGDPPAEPITAETPSTTATPPPTEAHPPDESPAPTEVPGPTEAPSTPSPSEPEPGEVVELERTPQTFEMFHTSIRYDEVAYSEPVRGAILRQLRATMRNLLDTFSPDSGDPEYPNTFDASCDAKLALETMVSYHCEAEVSEGRGMMDQYSATPTFEIAGDTIRALETDDVLVAGVDYDALEADPGGAVYLTLDAVGITDDGRAAEPKEISYRDLGTLLDPRSIAMRIPGVRELAQVETPLAQRAGPPETISVVGPARALPEAALLAARIGTEWLFADAASTAETAFSAETAALVEAPRGSPPAGLAASERAWSTPARLQVGRLRRSVALRPAARGRPTGDALPARTVLFAVLGEIGGAPSRTGGGETTFVVVSPTRSGWIPSALLDAAEVERPAECIERTVEALAEAERDAARARAFAMDAGGGHCVGVVPGAERTTYAFFPSAGRDRPMVLGVRGEHAGTLVEARAIGERAYAPPRHVALAWTSPSDPAHVTWEVVTRGAEGTSAGAPVLTLSLASASAPASARQTLTTGVTRRGTFYPIVVRGPGRAETLYRWNGDALEPASP